MSKQTFQNITLVLLLASYVALFTGASHVGRACEATGDRYRICKIAP